MDEWIDRFAEVLGQDAVAPKELGAILRLARDVAHGVERKVAPLSTFVAGVHVGRRVAGGMPREAALREALEAAGALMPDLPPEG